MLPHLREDPKLCQSERSIARIGTGHMHLILDVHLSVATLRGCRWHQYMRLYRSIELLTGCCDSCGKEADEQEQQSR